MSADEHPAPTGPATTPTTAAAPIQGHDPAQRGGRARLVFLIGGPALALAAWWALGPGGAAVLSGPRAGVAALAVWMAIWWMTEAIPLPATSLLPIVALPALTLGEVSPRQACLPYGDPVVFLFLGGFLLQAAMERWGLHRRVALVVILSVGTRPGALVAGVMAASAGLSMWVSNAATAAMMLPIAVSICSLVIDRAGHGAGSPDAAPKEVRNFAVCMALAVAYSATIGGLMTPIGTAPNVIALGLLRERGVSIGFLEWMALGVPVAAVLLVVAWLVLTRVMYPLGGASVPGGRELVRRELAELGPLSRGELATVVVFGLAVVGWVTRQPLCDALGWYDLRPDGGRSYLVDDATIAVAAGLLLFVVPIRLKPRPGFALEWSGPGGAAKLPLGVLLLFGGGLSLAAAIDSTGLGRDLSGAMGGLAGWSVPLLVLTLTLVTIFVSELVSNTALVLTVGGVVLAASDAMGLDPATALLPVALGASTAFMLPAGTPPNAIVFSSGYLRVGHMARAGLILNLVSAVVVTAGVLIATRLGLGR